MQQIKKATISAATIVEPTGVPARIDKSIPLIAQHTDNTTEHTVTLKNVLKIRIADSAGKREGYQIFVNNKLWGEVKEIPDGLENIPIRKSVRH